MKKQFNKKKLLTVLLVGILSLVVVNAALLTYYGQVKTTIHVEQPIVFTFDGKVYTGEQVSEEIQCSVEEKSCTSLIPYRVTNNGVNDRTVLIDTTGNIKNGVDVSYVGKLLLENKDASWNILSNDDTEAHLVYSVVGEEFVYEIEATGLQTNTQYSLIYYADKENRFDNWGGNNPGAMIVTATSDNDGNLVVNGSEELGMNLPSGADTNIDFYEYCSNDYGDKYSHCHGAKIWLVPTNDLPSDYPASGDWIFWEPHIQPEILFETDLVLYSNSANELIVPAGNFIEFYLYVNVDSMATTGDYVIYTTIDELLA